MKKIPLPLVFLFSVITLGIYVVVWYALRRNEMVEKYDQKIPHWAWLIAPYLIFAFILVVLTTVLTVQGMSMDRIETINNIASLVAMPILWGITIWWLLQFGRSVEYITSGKITKGWAVALSFFSSFAILFMQYYFNRVGSKEEVAAQPKQQRSGSFIALALVAIILGFVLPLIVFVGSALYEANQEQRIEQQKMQQSEDKANGLLRDYTECIDQLDVDFSGDITVDNEATYNAAYDKCEEIRIEQHEAAEAHNKNLVQ